MTGASQPELVIEYADGKEAIFPVHPRLLALYCGDHDTLFSDLSPEIHRAHPAAAEVINFYVRT